MKTLSHKTVFLRNTHVLILMIFLITTNKNKSCVVLFMTLRKINLNFLNIGLRHQGYQTKRKVQGEKD